MNDNWMVFYIIDIIYLDCKSKVVISAEQSLTQYHMEKPILKVSFSGITEPFQKNIHCTLNCPPQQLH